MNNVFKSINFINIIILVKKKKGLKFSRKKKLTGTRYVQFHYYIGGEIYVALQQMRLENIMYEIVHIILEVACTLYFAKVYFYFKKIYLILTNFYFFVCD